MDNKTKPKSPTLRDHDFYLLLIKHYPHFKTVIEEIAGDPYYKWHAIREHKKDVTFYFYQSAYVSWREADLIKKWGVSIQFPGNTDYNFSINIKKQEL